MKIAKVLMAVAIITTTGFLSCKPKDADIKTDVESKLSTQTDLSNPMASVTDGVVTISGDCKDPATKTESEKLAMDVKGVKSVVNDINVVAPPPPPMSVDMSADSTLTQAVSDAVKDFNGVTADIKDGVVTLTGTINKTALPKLMQTLNSLKPRKIENNLTIK